MAKEEKRLIGEYKVINSMFIGSKEVALCENLKDPHGLYYMTSDVHNNDFLVYSSLYVFNFSLIKSFTLKLLWDYFG